MRQFASRGWVWIIAMLALLAGIRAPRSSAADYPYAQPLLSSSQARNTGLHTLWQIPIGLTVSDQDRVLHLTRLGNLVYVLTARGFLAGINASAGTIFGSTKLPGDGDLIKGLDRYNKRTILMTALGYTLTMDTRTGKIVHRQSLDFAPGTSPLITVYGIFIGDLHGRMLALSHNFPLYTQWYQASVDDSFQTNPVLTGGMLVFASRNGVLWGRDPVDGQHGWKRRLGGKVTVGSLTAGDGLVFIPCLDQKLYAVDPDTGVAPWVVHLPGQLNNLVRVYGKKLLIATGGRGLFCLKAATGAKLWGPVPGLKEVIALRGSTLVAVTNRGNLELLDLKDGSIQARVRLNGAAVFAENPRRNNIFYVAARDGRVAALILRPEF